MIAFSRLLPTLLMHGLITVHAEPVTKRFFCRTNSAHKTIVTQEFYSTKNKSRLIRDFEDELDRLNQEHSAVACRDVSFFAPHEARMRFVIDLENRRLPVVDFPTRIGDPPETP